MCEIVIKCLLIIISVSLLSASTVLDRVKRQGTGNEGGVSSSTISNSTSSTQNITVKADSGDTGSIGLVVGVIVGVVFAVAVVALILMVYIKRKRDRDSEYARAAKVQRNSTMNAGVYNDLTAAPIVKKPVDFHKDSSEMESLNRADDEEV